MKKNRLLSFVTAVAVSATTLFSLIPEAAAETVTYKWDFTSTTYFTAVYDAGSSIKSNLKEKDAILKNPGATLSIADGKVTRDGSSVRVAKTESQSATAVSLSVPQAESATLSIELCTGSTGKAVHIKADGAASPVLTASDYSKNVLKEYTVSLEGGKTYYLDSTAYKVYIGKVELTLTGANVVAPDPEQTSGPEQNTEAPSSAPSELKKLSGEMTVRFDNDSGSTITETQIVGDGYVRAYASSSKSIAFDNSNKTIDGTKYSSRAKMGGGGTPDGDNSVRVLEVIPESDGILQVDFGHASSSGDERAIAVLQNGETTTKSVAAGATDSIKLNVIADKSVYIYSTATGAVNISGMRFTAGAMITPSPTPDPNATPPPEPVLYEMEYKMQFSFEAYDGKTFTSHAMIENEDGITCLEVVANPSHAFVVGPSSKTINGSSYKYRLRTNGYGEPGDDGYRCLKLIPKYAGSIRVDFGHSSSAGDPRYLYMQQGADLQEWEILASKTDSARFIVEEETPVYLYGSGDLAFYGVKYVPGDTATPAPAGGIEDPELAVATDAETLKIQAISQKSIYYDIPLPNAGKNGTRIRPSSRP